jgi:hypothetical protein
MAGNMSSQTILFDLYKDSIDNTREIDMTDSPCGHALKYQHMVISLNPAFISFYQYGNACLAHHTTGNNQIEQPFSLKECKVMVCRIPGIQPSIQFHFTRS